LFAGNLPLRARPVSLLALAPQNCVPCDGLVDAACGDQVVRLGSFHLTQFDHLARLIFDRLDRVLEVSVAGDQNRHVVAILEGKGDQIHCKSHVDTLLDLISIRQPLKSASAEGEVWNEPESVEETLLSAALLILGREIGVIRPWPDKGRVVVVGVYESPFRSCQLHRQLREVDGNRQAGFPDSMVEVATINEDTDAIHGRKNELGVACNPQGLITGR